MTANYPPELGDDEEIEAYVRERGRKQCEELGVPVPESAEYEAMVRRHVLELGKIRDEYLKRVMLLL